MSLEVVRRNNNFDGLRLSAAVAVIVGHAYVLTGRPGDVPQLFGLSPQYVGVCVFFAISGWLIAGSWERSRSVAQFVSSRALRILPLLFLVVLLSVFVMGPLVTTLSTEEYFASSQTWRYLVNLVLLQAHGLPGVFAAVPYPGVVNGSVWTLRAEVICYAAALGFGLLPRAAQTAGFVVFGIAAVGLAESGDVTIGASSVSAAAGAWIFFVVAALVRLHVPRRALRLDVAAGVVLAWAAVAGLGGAVWSVRALWLALPYVVVTVGLASWPLVRHAARWGDLSYGMYLWAFPVTQLVVQYAPPLPLAVVVAAIVMSCVVLSAASWHLLEKPAMNLRERMPWFRRQPASGPAADAGSSVASAG